MGEAGESRATHPKQLQYVRNSKAHVSASSCFSINLSRILHHVHSHMLASRGQSHVSKLSCAVTSFNHMNNQIACITCAESRLGSRAQSRLLHHVHSHMLASRVKSHVSSHVCSHVFCITCSVTCLRHVCSHVFASRAESQLHV